MGLTAFTENMMQTQDNIAYIGVNLKYIATWMML